MREAKFILPDDAGHKAVEYARQALLNIFGGYTVVQTSGAWRAPSGEVVVEQGRMFIVAMSEGWVQFRAIALEAGRLGKQEAVYVVSPTGEAEIVQLSAGKTDRVVEKDLDPHAFPPEWQWKRVPELGDLWRTQDNGVVCIIERTLSGKLYGKMLNPGTSGVSYGASIAYTDDGKVDMLEPGPHPLHLKHLINRNQG